MIIVFRKYFAKNSRGSNLGYVFTFWLIFGTIIGARIFYVFFYGLPFFVKNPVSAFYFWQGGLSFHGGLFGMIVAGLFLCKKYNVSFFALADLIALPAALFLMVGRVVNFFNQEIYGTVTSVPWCVHFVSVSGCRHPLQIYEALGFLFIFVVLLFLYRKNVAKCTLFFSFLFLYGFIRFVLDFTRPYSSYFLGLGVGQYFSVVLIIIGAYGLLRIKRA
jgi:phosphatidylglycerol:prolipoprotein diacylglycerol transferase